MKFNLPRTLCLSSVLLCQHGLASTPPSLMHVTSDKLSVQVDQNTASYQGDVVATHMNRTLNSNRLVILQGKNNMVKQATAYGSPAVSTVKPLPGSKQPESVGKANQIIYFPAEHDLRYYQHAVLTRDGNVFKGEVINYNTETNVATSPSTQAHPTTITIPPYNETHHDASS